MYLMMLYLYNYQLKNYLKHKNLINYLFQSMNMSKFLNNNYLM